MVQGNRITSCNTCKAGRCCDSPALFLCLFFLVSVLLSSSDSLPADLLHTKILSNLTRVHFPSAGVRSRRPFEHRRQNTLPSVTAGIVFPTSPPITEYTIALTTEVNNASVSSTTESPANFRDTILTPLATEDGRPDCLSGSGETYCETVANYPHIDLKNEVKMSKDEFREVFGSSFIDGRKSYADDESTEERVCRRIPRVVYPQMAKSQANQWLYVVNDVDYVQAVVSEVCEKEDRPCSYLEDHLPPGVSSRCRQKYSYKKLLAVHPTEKRTYTDTFRFPSCCACYITVPSGFEARKRSNVPTR